MFGHSSGYLSMGPVRVLDHGWTVNGCGLGDTLNIV